MNHWIVFLFSHVLLITEHVDASKKPRIQKGKDANIEDFPYQVAIREYSLLLCGGSIISERHILTAAHCFDNTDTSKYTGLNILTGTSYISKNKKAHKIFNVTIHPEFRTGKMSSMNDIAVITLKDKIDFDENHKTINLPKKDFQAGHIANLTGWGTTNLNLLIDPDQLQQFQTNLVPIDECQKRAFDYETPQVFNGEFCTIDDKETGVCYGDSGGPLAVDGDVVGIVSRTFEGGICGDGNPIIYTNVYKYKDFIESIVNQKS